MLDAKHAITRGNTALGIELGSTRIKAVLIGTDHTPLASGSYDWENRYENGIWTYSLADVWHGLQGCYRALAQDVELRYGIPLRTVGVLGFSAMMHGYLPFNRAGRLLTPFRTWRNTTTGQAAAELTALLGFNIPQRWSVAHLYQAILNQESHVADIDYLTTLAGYVHWALTGRRILGVGDASGMFPIDNGTYSAPMLALLQAQLDGLGLPWRLEAVLPQVLPAGAEAGRLTEKGALLLDPSGTLQAGIPLCPPEGDAGTGMTATNSVAPRTGNVSAGTSIFAMLVLERPLSRVYPEIDLVTTPTGRPVAMVHCNNCTSDLNAWVALFHEFSGLLGAERSMEELFSLLLRRSLEGDADCGGLLSYNYLSGEPITQLTEGRPMLVRGPESRFTLGNLMRTHLYSTMATLKLGMDILSREGVAVDRLLGHGGLFKTPGVAQRYLAAATNAPVTVMKTAGEGGAWGMALLAAYQLYREKTEELEAYLRQKVFSGMAGTCVQPDPVDAAGFDTFLSHYQAGLPAERAAAAQLWHN